MLGRPAQLGLPRPPLGSIILLFLFAGTPFAPRLDAQDEGPEFSLILNSPSDVCDDGGEMVWFDVRGLLVSLRPEEIDAGATAWVASLASDDCEIVAIHTGGTVAASIEDDPPGLRRGGFELNALTESVEGSCGGRSGAISAVTLSPDASVALDPTNSPHHIFTLTVAATIAEDPESTCGLEFRDDCVHEGTVYENSVDASGRSFAPRLGNSRTLLRACFGAQGVAIQVMEEAVGQIPSTEATSQPAEIIVKVPEGQIPRQKHIFLAIVSRLGDAEGVGLQGWSIAVGLAGDLLLTGATVDGTVAASVDDNPPGLRATGFEVTELVDPDRPSVTHPGGQGQGAVSAIVLSFTQSVTLDADGTATVLRLTLDADTGPLFESVRGEIHWPRALYGSGNPAGTASTVNGSTKEFDVLQTASIEFLPSDGPIFVRCDPNADGRLDISDTLAVLNFLFRGRPVAPCRESVDCDDDGILTIADAFIPVNHLFRGGRPPPAPYPDCGLDEDDTDQLTCERYELCE